MASGGRSTPPGFERVAVRVAALVDLVVFDWSVERRVKDKTLTLDTTLTAEEDRYLRTRVRALVPIPGSALVRAGGRTLHKPINIRARLVTGSTTP